MDGLRPTPDRVRETLFNWLGQDLYGRRCLDLFAGSGALGFEAASRGASEVVMVEKSRPVYLALKANKERLRCANVTLQCADGLEFARGASGTFDLILLDPPFASDYLAQTLVLLAGKLSPQGRVYAESGAAFEMPAGWRSIKQGRAGKVHYQLLERDD